MNISQIIKEKRRELSLTQEQIAEQLGVSTPAVSKWERGSTYPDITLLPALARLLKIDLNTLMSFNDDLTDAEIEIFVNEIDRIAQEQSYDAAFRMAIDKIHEYPTCDRLIYSTIFYLEGALSLHGVQEPGQYRGAFEIFYQRLSASEVPEIRDMATSMLIAYARNRGEYLRAEELINTLPISAIDREEQLAALYQQQKKYADAEKIWEHRILNGVTEIQIALINLLEIALRESRDTDASYFADRYEAITCQFSFPKWMSYNAHLLLAIEREDKDESLSILQKMLPAMREEWEPQKCPLYRSKENAGSAFLSSRLLNTLCDELSSKEEYDFLRNSIELRELIAQLKG